MQVRTISNIKYKNSIPQQKQIASQPKNVQVKSVVPYSSANIRANYMPSFTRVQRNEDTDYFFDLLDDIYVNEKPLMYQLNSTSFVVDEDFDASTWILFLNIFNQEDTSTGKTYLENFLSKNSFSELINSSDFDPNDILYVLGELKLATAFCNESKFAEIMHFVSDVDGSSYDAIERTKALRYFTELEDRTGESLFNSFDSRISRLSAYKYLMDINPSSVLASSMEMLLTLASEGVVGKHVFEFLPQASKISPLVLDDIDKLYNAYINGIEPIDAFVPVFDFREQGEQKLRVGDVFATKYKKNCYIMLDEWGNSAPLKIDRETYFKLFPPIERFASTQNDIGNCWEINVLRALYSTPESRYTVLRLFNQRGKDIVVKFKDGFNGRMIFENGQVHDEDKSVYSKGATGYQLLEQADGKELQAQKIKRYKFHLEALQQKDKALAEQKMAELETLLQKGNDNVFLEFDYRKNDWNIKPYKKIVWSYNSPETRNRDGGNAFEFLYRMGYRSVDELSCDDEDVDKLMTEDFNENLIFWSTKKNVQLGSNIIDGHSYFISSANYDENGNIKDYNVVNPWGMVEQRLTLEQLKEYGNCLTYAQKYSWI